MTAFRRIVLLAVLYLALLTSAVPVLDNDAPDAANLAARGVARKPVSRPKTPVKRPAPRPPVVRKPTPVKRPVPVRTPIKRPTP
ncbi:hypothetical protein EXIGLDRAFT_778780, partial [Exidia glandulosa HHB12029]